MSEQRAFDGIGLRLAAVAPGGLLAIRVRADDATARRAVGEALAMTLPTTPSRPSFAATRRLYWTAPDAILLDLDASIGAQALAIDLTSRLASHHVALHDVGDARTRIIVSGKNARTILAKGTGIDLDPRCFPPGAAALTRFAGLTTLLVHQGGAEDGSSEPRYELLIDRPTADWLWTWLLDAAREFEPT